jgi:hypothetical protein
MIAQQAVVQACTLMLACILAAVCVLLTVQQVNAMFAAIPNVLNVGALACLNYFMFSILVSVSITLEAEYCCTNLPRSSVQHDH